MPEFPTSAGASYALEPPAKWTRARLVLISHYLRVSQQLRRAISAHWGGLIRIVGDVSIPAATFTQDELSAHDLPMTAETTPATADDESDVPGCPRCDAPMVRRTARKGPHQGQQFWGCTRFPKCRATITDPPPLAPPATKPETSEQTEPDDPPAEQPPQASRRGFKSKLIAIAAQAFEAVDNAQRRQLESDEPDATGKWPPEHRREVLRYVHERDNGRCGLCAGKMKLQGAHIEHIVPKVFAVFDVRKGGQAETGTRYRSRLHKLDNLQAAHTYCNKRKGNTPTIRDWRHPDMSPLTVADSTDGTEFTLPQTPKKSGSVTRRSAQRRR